MKIAFISLMGGAPWGGSEVLWSKTAKLALEQGHKVFVSIYRFSKVPEPINILKGEGAIIHFREKYDPRQSFYKKLKSYIQIRYLRKNSVYQKLWNFKPDHIFISQGNNFDIAVHHFNLFEKIYKSKIPYSIVCHSNSQFSFIPQNNIYPRAKVVFLNAYRVFFISRRQKNITEKALLTKLNNSELTWNPLNLKDYNYVKWPDTKKIQFAVVGSLVSGKGHDIIIEILSHEKWRERDWHLNIYGGGYGKKYLQDLAVWYGISDRITLHGHVNDIYKVWEKNHILLIPSSAEGLPISLCEAMICGRPAVVTDVGGNREVIKDGKSGFISEAASILSFAKVFEKAWDSISIWKQMGINAHKFAIETLELQPGKKILNSILIKKSEDNRKWN